MNEKKIAELMKKLSISREEAVSLIADDEAIDHGEKLFQLSAEQEKVSKEARQVSRAPTAYKLDNEGGKRSKKIDNDKRFLIDAIVWLLTTDAENCGDNVHAKNVEILNPERELTFTYNEKKYKITLSAPRT